MKKMLTALVLVVLMMTMLASVATAANQPGSRNNTWDYNTIYCDPNRVIDLNKDWSYTKNGNQGQLYVRHYLWGDFGGVYTNYFQAKSQYTGDNTRLGGKWMMPDGAFYVSSASLKLYYGCKACGRANTDYGLTTIQITGYMHPDA